MNRLKHWLQTHSSQLLVLQGMPQAIAGGVAIGLFFSFTPLFGVKTLLSLLFAWLFRCNLIAAVIAVTLHDIITPFAPLLYRWEYDVGFWLLSRPHQWPESITHLHLRGHDWHNWTTFLTVGKPLLVGSLFFSTPIAITSYFITRFAVVRSRRQSSAPGATHESSETQ